MTTQKDKQKQKQKRAQKKKHSDQTEHGKEEAARHKRSHREAWIAIIIILAFIPFLLTGIFLWPGETGGGSSSGIGLADGSYSATYMSNGQSNTAILDIDGKVITVTLSDLSGRALADPGPFFEGQAGQQVQVTVRKGFITDYS